MVSPISKGAEIALTSVLKSLYQNKKLWELRDFKSEQIMDSVEKIIESIEADLRATKMGLYP